MPLVCSLWRLIWIQLLFPSPLPRLLIRHRRHVMGPWQKTYDSWLRQGKRFIFILPFWVITLLWAPDCWARQRGWEAHGKTCLLTSWSGRGRSRVPCCPSKAHLAPKASHFRPYYRYHTGDQTWAHRPSVGTTRWARHLTILTTICQPHPLLGHLNPSLWATQRPFPLSTLKIYLFILCR